MAKETDKVMQYKIEQNIKQKPVPRPAPKDVQSESSKMQQAEEEKQRKVDQEFERFQKNEPTRLKEQGGSMFAKGGKVGSASARADGCAQRGKTKGRMV